MPDRSRGLTPVFEIRPSSSLPAPELAALFNRCYEGYFVPMQLDEAALAGMARIFDLDLDAGLVALREGEPVGVVNLGVRGERGWIGGLGVVADARREGTGRLLMEGVHEEARSRGMDELVLEVIEANDPAFRLYEQLGYEMTRWLAIGSLEASEGDPPEQTPGDEAHARIRAARTAPEPWQRDDGTLRHFDDLLGISTDTGAAVYRCGPDGSVTVQQFTGDAEAARAILTRLRALGRVNLFNIPQEDPLLEAATALGARTALRQREMTLSLQ